MLRNAGFELLPFRTMFKFLRVAIGAGTLFQDVSGVSQRQPGTYDPRIKAGQAEFPGAATPLPGMGLVAGFPTYLSWF